MTGTLEKVMAQAGPAQIDAERTGVQAPGTRFALSVRSAPAEPVTMVGALNAALADALAANPRVLVFGGDVGTLGRRVPGHGRPGCAVRRGPGLRHAAG